MNFRYPIFLDVTGKRCIVAGEGYEVPSKLAALTDAKADVLYLNQRADERIAALVKAGAIRWEQRPLRREDLANCFLVISAQEDNAETFRWCEEERVLCNSVDDPEHCRFSFGSVHRQGDLAIAISTNGRAPALAVRLKEKLQREIGPEYAILLAMLQVARPEITGSIKDFAKRRELWYRIVDSELLELLRADQQEEAEYRLRQMIDEADSR